MIAGPNGAGKTTTAIDLFRNWNNNLNFIKIAPLKK